MATIEEVELRQAECRKMKESYDMIRKGYKNLTKDRQKDRNLWRLLILLCAIIFIISMTWFVELANNIGSFERTVLKVIGIIQMFIAGIGIGLTPMLACICVTEIRENFKTVRKYREAVEEINNLDKKTDKLIDEYEEVKNMLYLVEDIKESKKKFEEQQMKERLNKSEEDQDHDED